MRSEEGKAAWMLSVVKHGHAAGVRSPTYIAWRAMIQRCEYERHKSFEVYGGAGVLVCARWHSFELFLKDVGERPSRKFSLDRFPNREGNYEPGNVRWATSREQAQNRKSNHLISFGGETLPLIEWARKLGIKRTMLSMRIREGWSIERALTNFEPKSVGSKNPNATLTEEDVVRIRSRRDGGEEIKQIARDYRMGILAIYRVASRETWSHVSEEGFDPERPALI